MAGNEELISNYIDRAGFADDTEFAKARITEVLALYDKLANIKIGGNDKLGGVNAGVKEASSTLQLYDQSLQRVSQRIAQMNGQSKEFTNVLLLEAKASKELAAAKLNEAKAETEAAKAKQISEKASAASVKSQAAEKKLVEDATNDYLQLSRAYNEAALRAKNYFLRLGEGSPITKEAIKQANDIGNVLKKLDASVGQNQRNVGNYKSAFDGLGFSFTQISRELPTLSQSFDLFARAIGNNLPMVADEIGKAKREIASLRAEGKETPGLFSRIGKSIFSAQVALSVGITLFTVFAKQISSFVSSLFRGEKSISDFVRNQQTLTEVTRRTNEIFGNEIGNFQLLYKVATDANIPLNERRIAVDEIQKQYPKYFENINDEIILQGKAAKAYDATKAAILETAKAQAISGKLGELATKDLDLLEEDNKLTNDLTNATSRLATAKSKAADEGFDPKGAAASLGQGQAELRLIQQDISTRQKRRQEIKKEREENEKTRKFLLDQVTTAGISPTGDSGKGNDDLENRRRAIFEIEKLRLERVVETNKAIFEDEKQDFVVRLDAYKKYIDARNGLIDLQTNFEKGKKDILSEEIRLADESNVNEKLKLEIEQQKDLSKIRDSEMKKIAEDMKRRRRLLMFSYGEELVDAKNYYDELAKAGLISFEKAKELKKQEEKLQEDFYKKVEKQAEDFIKRNEDREKAALEKRKANDKLYKDSRKKLEEELITELTELTFTFINASAERQKNAIQDQIDALENRKAKEIEVANQTIASTQERADAIAVIEARANAQKEQLQQKQRRIQQDQARFEKAASIASIVQKTAEAIIGFLAKPGGVQGVQLSVLAGLIGAAQLAAVVAQPIPKYKEGTKDHPGGRAIVGDGGIEEIVITPDGKVMKTPAKDTLVDLPKHSIVLPDANVAMNYAIKGTKGINVVQIENAGAMDSKLIVGEISSMKKAVVSAIKKQPQPIIKTDNILSRRIRRGDNSNTYLNDNLQG